MERLRNDRRVVVLVAACAAALAATAGAEPTGTDVVDLVLVAAAVAITVVVGSAAPWWTVVVMAAVATVTAPSPVIAALGAAAVAGALVVGLRNDDSSVALAVVVGVAANLLLRLELDTFVGAPTVVGIGATIPALVGGLRRLGTTGRVLRWTAIGLVAFVAVAIVGVGVAAASASSDLSAGNGSIRAGLEEFDSGDFDAAAARFQDAAESFTAAERALEQPWTLLVRVLPIAAQHHGALTDLSARGGQLAARIGDALAVVDVEAVRPVDGRVDLDAIVALQAPLRDVETSVAQLRNEIDDADSPWLLAPLARRLDDVAADVDERTDALATLVDAVEIMPTVLGADGPRRHLIAFTTPAEARGLGGFMGNYAEVTTDDGTIEVTRSGRTGDLNRAGVSDRRVTGPPEWLDLYGALGFTTGPDATTGRFPWSNVTLSPHFPSTAAVIAELYPQSGGRALDGVIAMDPKVLAVLVGFTGAIDLDDEQPRLTESNLVDFLLIDQYAAANEERLDLLETVSSIALDRLLDGALPDPQVLVEELGPLAGEGRLLTWSRHPDEQALFDRAGLSGALPVPDADGVAFVINNGGANKLDAYLDRSLTYRGSVDTERRTIDGEATISLTNNAPTTGFGDGVIGNYTGDPIGTNRARLSIYTAHPPTSVTLDDEPIAVLSGREQGWYVSPATVLIPPGDTVTITLDVGGEFDDTGYSFTTFVQPLANPLDHDISVDDVTADGSADVTADGSADGSASGGGAALIEVTGPQDGFHRWEPDK